MNEFDKTKNNLKDDANDLYSKAQEKASDRYNDAKNATHSKTEQVKESVSEMYEEGLKKINQTTDYVCHSSGEVINYMKAKPVKSFLIALGTSFLLSKLLRK
ncbi:MAG: DUF883 domain-containing protein [Tatlockia sp.]|nr:DUF883 domain-containing protein [Tatlockia sp.]MBA3978356.1 DUF883 domain-containing protein [Nitrosopumilus sp.]